ncbi:NlpC/P60 family protein [Kitasatospora sp. NPDC004669]|uniref:C40 family peptidase n=1 Tax=Kitasatospora sp. NPDC004669 TaxID=3154555 RepID=UPI0033A9E718
MSGKAVAAAVGVVALAPVALALPVVLMAAGNAQATCSSSTGVGTPVDSSAVDAEVKAILSGQSTGSTSVQGLDLPSVQIPNAQIIVQKGVELQMPARGQVIALATALQESGLQNLPGGDRDSVGLFQQRPSQGWGTAAQISQPAYAAGAFYQALLKVPGWQDLPVAEAAQAVQGSGFPDAYAKWEPLATALQQALVKTMGQSATPSPQPSGSGSPSPQPSGGGSPAPTKPAPAGACGSAPGGTDWGTIPPGVLPAGYQIPTDAPPAVQNAIRYALGQLGTPYQWGGSCTAAHGPDPMGRCDCSSLMQQSYAAAGVTISRTTYTQVNDGSPASLDALRPGDLLFMEGTPQAPEHVGMYIGDGLVVHAPHTGTVVSVSTLASWRPSVLAARRIVA